MPQKQLKDKKFSELKWGSGEAYSFRNDNIIKSDIFSKNWNKKESTDMPKSSSIGECYQIWKKENQNSLNPLTFHRYNNLLQRHLIPQFFNTPAEDITEHEIDCFVSKKQEENMSEVTLNMLIMLLKRLLQIAGIDTVKLGLEHTVRVRTGKRSIEIMEEEEQNLLDIIINSIQEQKYLGICLAFKMGLSVGEICALEWEDVDFENGTIQVKNTVQRIQNKKEDGRKTLLVKMQLADSTKRELPLPHTLFNILKTYRQEKGYVLQCKKGKLPDPRREQIRLEKFFEKQEMTGYNFHILRDTFAVRCIRAGMSMENLSYVLGHASVAITAERYKEFLETKQERITIIKRIMELV